MNRIIFFFFISFLSVGSYSQELRCGVELLSPTIQNTVENKLLLEQLKKAVFNFMNNTKWTTESFKNHEKIESSLLITVNNLSGNTFEGKLQVSSRRPVFNTNYTSTVVSTLDNSFDFVFQLNAPLLYSNGTYTNNLTSVLAFYAYYIIGMDYDTYSLEGGTKYLLKAQEVSNLAQTSGQKGWNSSGSRNNRYWIIENILNVQFKGMRKCSYEYHRLGLDLAYKDSKVAVITITKALGYLQQVHEVKPGSVNMKLFFVAKSDEIVNIYSEASTENKKKTVALVKRMDPSNIQKYDKILKN